MCMQIKYVVFYLILLSFVFFTFLISCSVPVPYNSDRLKVRTDERWSKLIKANKSETRIMWTDLVQKMNRSDAKVV